MTKTISENNSETAYLLSTAANRAALVQSLYELADGKIVEVDL